MARVAWDGGGFRARVARDGGGFRARVRALGWAGPGGFASRVRGGR
ncbi:hypothetical protein ATKI12_8482 [Kitasatospora sp. Ki12]